MKRVRTALLVLAIVLAACSSTESADTSTTSSPPPATDTTVTSSTSTVPPTTPVATTAVPAVAEFVGTAPVVVNVGGTLWDLRDSPPARLATLPGNRSQAGPPVSTPYGIVAADGANADSNLWLIDPASGEQAQLTSGVGSFAVAADDETVAWAEHVGPIGDTGSQTRLTESSLPGFAERASITLDGFARVVGYAGDTVMLETGDGEGAVVTAWVPATGAVTTADGYVWVLGTSPVQPNAVLATSSIEPRWVVVLSDGAVLPEASNAVDPPWIFEESQTVSFSPDGTTMAMAGTEPVVTLREVSTRSVIARIPLDGLPGDFFSAKQLTWQTDDTVLLLAETWDQRSETRPHAGQRFIYSCSVSASACERAAEIVYEPRDFDEVALVTRTLPPRAVAQPTDGWKRIEVDPALIGDVAPVEALGDQGIIAIAGCHRSSPADWYPMWVSVDAETWERATGPEEECLDGLVRTEFGWVTWGRGGIYVSQDARQWRTLDGPWADEPGWTQFVATIGTVTTVLRSRAAESETTIASLWTSIDGESWESHPDAAELFDSSAVAEVIEGSPGLIAVGASPGGEFVPTAAVWTSADGSSWDLVSPRGEGFADATMFDVSIAGPGYVAVGTDWQHAAFWWSEDGTTWTRAANTAEDPPEFGHLVARDITLANGMVYASGFIWDADAPSPQPRMWVSPDGRTWEPAEYDEYAGRLPFGVSGFEKDGGVDLGVAFWPGPHDDIATSVTIFVSE